MTNVSQQMAQGMSRYYQPRLPNEVDLYTEVRNAFAAYGMVSTFDNHFATNRFIMEAVDKNSEVQRLCFNRYLNQLLFQIASESQDIRCSLINDGTAQMWLTIFTNSVLPFIIDRSNVLFSNS